jgi:long-chain acyl-CoA synthetase
MNHSPTKIALQLNTRSFTFAQLQEAIKNCSYQLEKHPKGILIITAQPTFEFIVQFLSAMAISKPMALFSNILSEEEKQHRIALLGTAMTVDNESKLINLYENKSIKPHHQLALVLFTSGSTGQVKAVQLSLKNIEANCDAVIKALEFSKVQSQLLFLPLSYSFGLLGQLVPGLKAGLTTQLIDQFTDIKSLFEKTTIPQMWSGVPSHWVALSKMGALYPESAAQIKAVISAGAPLSLDLRTELKKIFYNATIYNNYGLTEASPRVLTYSSADPYFMEDYAGYPVGDWQVRLSDEDELLIQGSQMMLGYLGEPSNENITDGWLGTGDIAELQSNGLVAIKGRRDNLVKIGGEKISLNELERTIGHCLAIKEVIVVPSADEYYGTRLLACIERSTLSEFSEQQVTEQIKQYLLPKILPINAYFVEKLPHNHHGKLDRKALVL